MTNAPPPFWHVKPLLAMSEAEWESLCDGCGKCCLGKLEYEGEDGEPTGEVEFTDIACHLFDPQTCRCTDYPNRSLKVPDCVKVTPDNVGALYYMPPSCAYRLLSGGKDLPDWHPLVSGNPETVFLAGHSARGRTVSEADVTEEDWPHRIVEWPWKPA